MKNSILMLLFISLTVIAKAQVVETFEFDTIKWILPEKYQILEFQGKHALLIERVQDNGYVSYWAYLKDYDFSDGIIEFDLFCPRIAGSFNEFVGFIFRLNQYREEDRFELFFFQPPMSSSIGSVQYLPVNNGFVNWPNYNKDIVYQSAGNIPDNEWIHIKADIEGPHAIVYVNDKEVMTVNNLGRGLSRGSVGVWLGNSPKCYYANFKVTK